MDDSADGAGNAVVHVGIFFAARNARFFRGLAFEHAGIIFSRLFAREGRQVPAFEFAQGIFHLGHDLNQIAYSLGCLPGASLWAGVQGANVKVISQAFADEHGLLFAPTREGHVRPPAATAFAIAFCGMSMADQNEVGWHADSFVGVRFCTVRDKTTGRFSEAVLRLSVSLDLVWALPPLLAPLVVGDACAGRGIGSPFPVFGRGLCVYELLSQLYPAPRFLACILVFSFDF